MLFSAAKRMIKLLLKHMVKIQPKILFESFNGVQYSDNPRAISEMLHSMYPKYQIVWLLRNGANRELVPDYVESVSQKAEYYRSLFSCFCYVSNCPFQGLTDYKKQGQLFVQTWHGDRGFKKILYQVTPDESKVEFEGICDAEVTDIALAGSTFGLENYRTGFRYNGRVDKFGCPRNERMLSMSIDEKERIRRRLGIENGTRVFLYAPTFRDNMAGVQKIYIDVESTRRAVAEKYGGKWVAIVRGHVGKKLTEFHLTETMIDATDYLDMADILSITDFLITDYSSTAFDYYLTGKPMVLAVFDLKEYEADCRGIRFDPIDKGFICARNQEELLEIISRLDEEELRRFYERIDRCFETCETGSATKRICEAINDHYIRTFGNG